MGSPASRGTFLRRFTILTLGTTIVVGIIFGTVVARMVESFALRQQARAVADRVLEVTASTIALATLQELAGAPDPSLQRMLRNLVDRSDIVQITMYSADGQVLYRAGESPADETAIDLPGNSTDNGQLQWRLRGTLLRVEVPILAADVPGPVGFYRLVTDISRLAPPLARVIWSVQLSVVLGVLMLYAALFTIVRRASADLDRSESALRWAFVGIIRSLVNALDARDMATAQHSSRVAENGVAIARVMGLAEEAVAEVRAAAFLHDIGKIGIPDGLLTKEGPLAPAERATMERHAEYGHAILDPVAIPSSIKLAVRHSHEWWDGRGYPDGLAGAAIPLAARIISVADAYEAITTARPYRPARPPADAVAEIARSAGSQFDPEVVKAALQVWKQPARSKHAGRMAGRFIRPGKMLAISGPDS